MTRTTSITSRFKIVSVGVVFKVVLFADAIGALDFAGLLVHVDDLLGSRILDLQDLASLVH